MGNNTLRDEASRISKIAALLRPWRTVIAIAAGFLTLLILPIVAVIGIAFNNVMITEQKANAGNADEQRVLGHGYESGCLENYSLGTVDRDLSKAAYWYSRSAKQCNGQAAFDLASMYERRFSGTANHDALFWYTQSAELGESDAASHLGEIYQGGLLDQPIDSKKSHYYFALASRLKTKRK